MSYASIHAIAVDPAFVVRVRMAMRECGRDIGWEDVATPNHEARARLGIYVQRFPDLWTEPFAYRLAEMGLSGTSTDAEIKTGCASVWETIGL